MNSSLSKFVCFAFTFNTLCAASAGDTDFFETRIRPVLVQHCYECHSSAIAEAKGDLQLDFRDGIRNGGESGPSVVPGEPDESLILEALRHESFEMPPNKKLDDSVIADFETWIKNGAVDPRTEAPSAIDAAGQLWKTQLAERKDWWSLQPLKQVSPPTVPNSTWSQKPVDRFILAAHKRNELSPAAPANAEVILRRLSFVLTGLPPTPMQVRAFPADFKKNAEGAITTLVDELLQSPQFGERFARHWMDVVRYTDTYGYEWDNPAKGSWEYRDYLIRMFNDDIGFHQFLREQIAGDLFPIQRIHPVAKTNESMIAPMFYHMGEHRHGSSLDFNGIHQEMINNKIDVFSKAFLAMTVGCARCHDHKLDAISQADYYALAGIFMSPRWTSRVIDKPGKQDDTIQQLKSLRSEIQKRLTNHWQPTGQSLSKHIQSWATNSSTVLGRAKPENIEYPLAKIIPATDDTIKNVWVDLSKEWQTQHNQRTESNSKHFTTLTDFTEPGFPANWTTEGDGIKHGHVANGTPLVSLKGDTFIDRLLPRGYHTNALSSKLPGALRLPPQHELAGSRISLNLRGGEWAGYLVAPQNAFQSEAIKFFDADRQTSRWMTRADDNLKNGVTRVFMEVATSSLNPNFPPRTGLATAGKNKLPHNDQGFDKRSWFSLTGIVTHDQNEAPQDTLDAFQHLYMQDNQSSRPPNTVDEAWQRIGTWCANAVRRWTTGRSTLADVEIINWLLHNQLLPNQLKNNPEIAELVHQYRKTESEIGYAKTANSMDERNVAPLQYRLNVRGDVDVDGPAIPRRFLEVFSEHNSVNQSQRSGRLELAAYLGSRDNPQTARVYVNRVWQWIFGQGIVATPSDFGKLGDRPSHPELLDWLAADFMANNWSTKTLVRKLVLSQTFRQSSLTNPIAVERDPENRLLHHYTTRRLEAEAIRDALLAASGSLDLQMYGRPIDPPRAVEDAAKRLFSGPLDSNGRRSIYMKMSIMAPPTFLTSFNLPDLKLPTGHRDVTNVPAQALVLLNNPLVVQLANHWGSVVVADNSTTVEDRVQNMFLQALGRQPTNVEERRWATAVKDFSTTINIMTDTAAWAELGHAFFNTKEFIYYR